MVVQPAVSGRKAHARREAGVRNRAHSLGAKRGREAPKPPLLQVDRFAGGRGVAGAVPENHCRAKCSAGAAVRASGHPAHRVARGEEARDRLTAHMQHARVAIGAMGTKGGPSVLPA